MKITRFEDLKVWQLSHELALKASELVKTFPKNEKYDLVSQMRRSARCIPSDISEGFGRFHFNDKLTFYERARASLGELRNHFMEALGNRYIDEVTYNKYKVNISEVGFLLNKMIRNIKIYRDNHNVEKKCIHIPAGGSLPMQSNRFQHSSLPIHKGLIFLTAKCT